MRRESASERDAWTSYVEGVQAARPNKYGAVRTGKYASKKEAEVAANLAALAAAGKIRSLAEQVTFTLVEGNGKIRPIRYVADFTYWEDDVLHVIDVKGFKKNQVYRLKKKLLILLRGIEIEEW